MSSDISVASTSIEYLYVDVSTDVTLDVQPVAVGIGTTVEDVTWHDATWQGEAGTDRSARILLDGTLEPGVYRVFVRITDSPEIPVVKAGVLRVRAN